MDGSDVYEVDCKIELVKNDKGGNFSLDRLGISSKEMMEDPNKIRKFYITYGKIANIFKIAATKDKVMGSGLKRLSGLQIKTGTMNIVSGKNEPVSLFDDTGVTLTLGGQIIGGDDTKIKLLFDGLVGKKLESPDSEIVFNVCSAKKGPPFIPKEICDLLAKFAGEEIVIDDPPAPIVKADSSDDSLPVAVVAPVAIATAVAVADASDSKEDEKPKNCLLYTSPSPRD